MRPTECFLKEPIAVLLTKSGAGAYSSFLSCGVIFLGNCCAALIFWFFFIKKKERQSLCTFECKTLVAAGLEAVLKLNKKNTCNHKVHKD